MATRTTKKAAPQAEGQRVEVKIGVQHARELVLEVDATADDILAQVNEAMASGALVRLTDAKGREVFVPADRLAFIEIGAPTERRVGFAG